MRGRGVLQASASHLDLDRAPYDLYGVKYIDLVPPHILLQTMAKMGQFGTIIPGLKDLLFIVTSKPEFGECLFTAETGKFGGAICT